ncbi:winged helix-turn-helix domain-containing protein [Natrinema saccharevitans]|uniref:winged helix-turn-helix domain-containing protein n=1 Tax=Natrinema saccharevitans TaxID=301967 RepID=UPI000970208C|nr:winged helix-turn-helix domain-containing protein [Natrinema saccharevitans]
MTDTELPKFINRDLLRDPKTVEVPDQALLKCFVQANKPFLSKSAVAEMTGLSDEGTRKRLNSLVERGILLSAEAGRQTKIYWLNNPRSRWPVPADLDNPASDVDKSASETIIRINRLTTFAMLYAGIFTGIYFLDWLSDFPMTDGVFEVSLIPEMMPALAFVSMAILFYVALQTSLHVENDDAGWPTIRRVYRHIVD